MEQVITATLWFAAVSVGIMAGVYFAFSAFVMQSLDASGRATGMLAMQSINRVILKSLFLPLFFTSSLACLLLAVFGLMQWGTPGAWQMVIGGALYIVGMLVVTAAANVPLNNALEATDAAGPDAEAMWRRYMQRWLPWNHVRTVSCTVSLILLISAIAAR
ncbi:MAG: anthrone oxygenase family protein [Parasphingorhabdus sp.]